MGCISQNGYKPILYVQQKKKITTTIWGKKTLETFEVSIDSGRASMGDDVSLLPHD